MAESAYASLTEIEQEFKTLVWDPMILAIKKALQGYLSFLAWPIISSIYSGIFDYVAGKIFEAVVLFIDVSAIRLKNAAHEKAYNSASLKLKIVSIEKGQNSDEYRKALNEALDVMSAFTQFGR